MIILEGPDGAGKTTLASTLTEHFDLKMGERGTADRARLFEVTVPDTYRALTGAIEGRAPARVWDRLFYSEFVYAPIVDRPCEFNDSMRSHICRQIEALTCPVIVCLPPVETVIENAAKDEQMDGVIENLRSIYHAYQDLLVGTFPGHTYVYDYTAPRSAEILDGILEHVGDYLEERRDRQW